MSTYYYLVCEDCKERCDGASRRAGGYGYLGDSEEVILPFIIAHGDHNTQIVSQHDDRTYKPEYESWTAENLKAMIKSSKDKGHWR